MGNRFEITVVNDDLQDANAQIDLAIAEISRIEQLLSTYIPGSQTNEINFQAGIRPVVVDREVFNLIYRSLRISSLTQGAFDLTYGSIDKSLWNFDLSMTALPDQDLAARSVRLINYRNIMMNKEACTVFLKKKGMRIGFGGIGKGYAADMARIRLLAAGVGSGIVNAAGDLVTWGLQPDGKTWTIGIANPEQANIPFSTLNISNMAIATSGNYEKFVVIDGKKYSHTIDPRSGYPVSGIKSVTVICSSAELADALATPVMVMGRKVGLNMINQMKNVACIVIDDRGKTWTSDNIRLSE